MTRKKIRTGPAPLTRDEVADEAAHLLECGAPPFMVAQQLARTPELIVRALREKGREALAEMFLIRGGYPA